MVHPRSYIAYIADIQKLPFLEMGFSTHQGITSMATVFFPSWVIEALP